MELFYDTCALLNLGLKAFETPFIISQQTLLEIEDIKTSAHKDSEIKYKARQISRCLIDNPDKYSVVPLYAEQVKKYMASRGLPETSDNIIVASAASINTMPILFVTDDINCRFIARDICGLKTKSSAELDLLEEAEYTGYKEVVMDDVQMAYFYSNPSENIYDLNINQYLIIKNTDNEVVAYYRWDGTQHIVQTKGKPSIKTQYFDKLKTKDVFQDCAVDAMLNCDITALSGKAGSGKSLLSLMVAMYLIEKGKYDRLVILFNPTKTRGASDLGFYTGDALGKAMQNSIGQILITKFGDPYIVDFLIQQDKLRLVSMADARGMEIRDNEILWITECQNTSKELIKLCLTRVSSGAKVFIEGDYNSQVDSYSFEGNNNGLKRVIEKFKNNKEFAYVQLQKTYRSKIAELCELLD